MSDTEGPIVLSPDGLYRYRLERIWNLPTLTDRLVLWCMLNPSTADADRNDPTVRRCVGFSKRLGADGLIVVNLYALRATDPKRLSDPGVRPIGPDNDRRIVQEARAAWFVVAAWGDGVRRVPGGQDRAQRVLSMLRIRFPVYCLGHCKSGEPRHPLMVRNDTPFEPIAKEDKP